MQDRTTPPDLGSGTRGATIFDVAALAGVSIRTVSRVINESPRVNGQTRARIQRVIAELGFHPSARARGLATGRSFLIGVVHNDSNALVLDAILRGVVRESADRGYEMIVHPVPATSEDIVADIGDFVRRSRVDGLVVLPPLSSVADLGTRLAADAVPCVALSSVSLPGFVSLVVSDERDGAAQVARHLIALGHRRIALLSGPPTAHSASERRAGFTDALAGAGLALVASCDGDYSFNAGVRGAEMLLESSPTAIFAANDIMAAGVLKVAASRGIAVPRDLSVVGFDGSLLSSMLTPALTSVYRPIGDMSRQATANLLDAIQGQSVPAEQRTGLFIVPGETVRPPRA